MSSTTEEEVRTIEQVRKELQEARAAEQKLQKEQQELKEERSATLGSDDPELLSAALSGKPLKKSSAFRQQLDRESELPGLIHVLRRKVLDLQIEIAELELEEQEQERQERSQHAYQMQEKFLQVEHERNMAQSLATGAAEDVKDTRRRITNFRSQLVQLDSAAPSADHLERLLAERKVWRGVR